MRSVLFAGVSVFLLAFPAAAQKEPVTGVIGSRTAAFLKGDAGTAVGHAAPDTRQISDTFQQTGAMARKIARWSGVPPLAAGNDHGRRSPRASLGLPNG